LGDPILCRLGFHKWQDYGKEVKVFWEEPSLSKTVAVKEFGWGTSAQPTKINIKARSKVVHEGKQCTRCGMKLSRKFVTNSDGTLACVGWEPDTGETDKE